MLVPPANEPLTDEQFDRLEAYLGGHAPAGVNIEWVDGYFAALICALAIADVARPLVV